MKKSARILIVEDDEDDFVIARDYLEELDDYVVEIDWVSNPTDALQQLTLNQHDICLLDYQLGAKTGLTVLEKTTEIQCSVPVIMLTGQSDKVLDKAALDAGAVDFIVKSELDGPRLARGVRYALARQAFEKERLERINIETQIRTKDRFLAHLSHELRTPLTSILGYTELLLSTENALPVEQELNIILNNGNHLLSLINDVLDLSKIAANKLEMASSTFNLNNFLIDIINLLQVSANDKGIELTLTATTSLPEEIHSDPTRLRQVLINLIHNSIKFTDQGKVSITVKAQIENGQCDLCFDVKDTGKGIPFKKIDKIFQPFMQLEDSVSREETGAGLGLAISSELATKLGGGITATSTVGEGSIFTLKISCPHIKGCEMTAFSANKKVLSNNSTSLNPLTGKVLVVDDVADIRMLIGHILESFSLDVEFAENGRQAVNKVKHSIQQNIPYDAILMDIHMPEMDGKEAVVKIREQGFEQHILALTAATMKGVKEDLQILGFDDVISKPVDRMLLRRHLLKILSAESKTSITPANILNQAKNDNKYFLLVEDDIDAANITKILLESMGVNVAVAHSGLACRQLFHERKQWHKILLDVHLPDESGLELAKYLVSQNNSVDIVIVSGAEIDTDTITSSGCSGAIMKPLNKEKLLQLVL